MCLLIRVVEVIHGNFFRISFRDGIYFDSEGTAKTGARTNGDRGTVSDVSGQVLPGVTVMLKGTTIGTATDMQGHYQMVIPKTDKPVLVFSFIGMKNAERSFNEGKPLK